MEKEAAKEVEMNSKKKTNVRVLEELQEDGATEGIVEEGGRGDAGPLSHCKGGQKGQSNILF